MCLATRERERGGIEREKEREREKEKARERERKRERERMAMLNTIFKKLPTGKPIIHSWPVSTAGYMSIDSS